MITIQNKMLNLDAEGVNVDQRVNSVLITAGDHMRESCAHTSLHSGFRMILSTSFHHIETFKHRRYLGALQPASQKLDLLPNCCIVGNVGMKDLVISDRLHTGKIST